MKLTLPSRVPFRWVAWFVFVLFALEIAEGTTAPMAGASCAFIVVASLAFNLAGGLQYPSGAYIFFCALLTSIVGVVGKVVLREPLQTNLVAPLQTMLVYLLGMCSILVAAALNYVLRRRRVLISDTLEGIRIDHVAIGCMLMAIIPPYILPRDVVSTFVQFNYFGILAVMLPVYQKVKDSDGRSSFSLVALGSWAYLTFQFGIVAFSKQGLFLPSFTWAAAAVSAGYRASTRKLTLLAVTVIPAMSLLTAFSQVGRTFRDSPNPTAAAINLLAHPLETMRLYRESEQEQFEVDFGYHWYDKRHGLMDRLSIVPVDDALIYVTDHGNPGSLYAIWTYFLNIIPRYLYPTKPIVVWGNVYGRKIGLLDYEDVFTGISFSPFADAYHTGRWYGLTVIACPMFLLLFFVSDSIVGPAKNSRWAILYILWFSHAASEGMLNAVVYGATTFALIVIVAYLCGTRVAPILGGLITLPQRELSSRAALRGVDAAGTIQSSRV